MPKGIFDNKESSEVSRWPGKFEAGSHVFWGNIIAHESCIKPGMDT